MADTAPRHSLSVAARAMLAARVWARYISIRLSMRRQPLPAFVAALGQPARPAPRAHPPARLSAAVHRCLGVGRARPRCLYSALVLYRLLREQGDAAQLVIGLPLRPTSRKAHAWVELGGRDVGPPPGGRGQQELARYG